MNIEYLTKLKNKLKNGRFTFPAQEIWLNDENGKFWAYQKDNDCVDVTVGYLDDVGIQYKTTPHFQNSCRNIDNWITKECEKRREENYYPFIARI
jgi:hypothetical protein